MRKNLNFEVTFNKNFRVGQLIMLKYYKINNLPSLRNLLYSESFRPTLAPPPSVPLSKAIDGSFAELGVDKDC